MLTDDKAQAGENYSLNDNVNTRDQQRALIWLVVLTVVALGFLVALGQQHVGGHAKSPGALADGTTAGNVLEFEDHNQHSSVTHAIGAVELPGHIGKAQGNRGLTAGNTPWTVEETDKLGAVARAADAKAAEEHAAAAAAAKHDAAASGDAKKTEGDAAEAAKKTEGAAPATTPAPAAH